MANSLHPKTIPLEPIGKRIARLRNERGWTQQNLAARLAASRVAVSHIEMDLTLPSERTITLLAGLFKLSPQELVDGTTYPQAKAEKLPERACCYTPLELELALLDNDLAWLERLPGSPERERLLSGIRDQWLARLTHWSDQDLDENERRSLSAARQSILSLPNT